MIDNLLEKKIAFWYHIGKYLEAGDINQEG
jgi:hypothetical protein